MDKILWKPDNIQQTHFNNFIGLVNSGSRPGKAGRFLPLGLAYLSATLKNHGYQYDCIDLQTEEIMNASKTGDLWDHFHHFDFFQIHCLCHLI